MHIIGELHKSHINDVHNLILTSFFFLLVFIETSRS